MCGGARCGGAEGRERACRNRLFHPLFPINDTTNGMHFLWISHFWGRNSMLGGNDIFLFRQRRTARFAMYRWSEKSVSVLFDRNRPSKGHFSVKYRRDLAVILCAHARLGRVHHTIRQCVRVIQHLLTRRLYFSNWNSPPPLLPTLVPSLFSTLCPFVCFNSYAFLATLRRVRVSIVSIKEWGEFLKMKGARYSVKLRHFIGRVSGTQKLVPFSISPPFCFLVCNTYDPFWQLVLSLFYLFYWLCPSMFLQALHHHDGGDYFCGASGGCQCR